MLINVTGHKCVNDESDADVVIPRRRWRKII